MACRCRVWLWGGTSRACFACWKWRLKPSPAAPSWLTSCCSAAAKVSREASHCSGKTGAAGAGRALLDLAARQGNMVSAAQGHAIAHTRIQHDNGSLLAAQAAC